MARNSNALSLRGGLHKLFMSVSVASCSLPSALLGLALFVSVLFFGTSGFACFTGCVPWWYWLGELPGVFYLFQLFHQLLVTSVFLSCKKILLCYCSLFQSSVQFFVLSRVLRV